MLQDFVANNRAAIIAACGANLAKRAESPSELVTTARGGPMFFDQLLDELHLRFSNTSSSTSAPYQHDNDLLQQGYTVSEVVHGYGDVCQAITDTALVQEASIGTDDLRMLDRCLDDATAGALTQRDDEARDRNFDGERTESDRVKALARELQRVIRTSRAALEVMTEGKVSLAGSTSKVLRAGLATAEDMVGRLIGEVNGRRRRHDVSRHDSAARKN